MLRCFFIIFFVLSFTISSSAQVFNAVYQSGNRAPSPAIFSKGKNGNLFIHGHFNGSADFQPDTGVLNRSAMGYFDLFIQLLDGKNRASKFAQFGTKTGATIIYGNCHAQDDSGNYILAGTFNNTFDADPGSGQYMLTAKGSRDIFVIKLDSNLQFKWAGQMSSKVGFPDYNYLFKVDAQNNVYALLPLCDTTDVDLGSGTHKLYGYNTKNNYLLAKYTAWGSLVWAKKIGGTASNYNFLSKRLEFDDSGNMYLQGDFGMQADFDPDTTAATYSASATDLYILKLDKNGSFQWVKTIGGSGQVFSTDLICKNSRLYSSGSFQGKVDFDPGSSSAHYLSEHKGVTGSGDYYLLQLDLNGNFVRANQIKTSAYLNQQLYMKLDDCDGLYAASAFLDTVYTSLNGYSKYLTTPLVVGKRDIFLVKYDTSGNFKWHVSLGAGGIDLAGPLLFSRNNDLLMNGTFENTVDFDPGPDSTKLDYNNGPSFLLSLNEISTILTVKALAGTVCEGSKATIMVNGSICGSKKWHLYQDSCNGQLVDTSTGGTFYVYPTKRTSYFAKGGGGCAPAGDCKSIIISTNPWVAPEITISSSDSDNVICSGSKIKFTSAIKNGGTARYQWRLNNQIIVNLIGASSIEIDSLKDGDSVLCIMTSNASCVTPSSCTSNIIHFRVKPVLQPELHITSSDSDGYVCYGNAVQMQAQVSNAGTNAELFWYKNDSLLSEKSAILQDSFLAKNSVYWCYVKADYMCPTQDTVHSGAVNINSVMPRDSIAAISTCNQFIFDGITYFGDTVLTKKTKNRFGCDSMMQLHVSVWKDKVQSLSERACGEFNYAGNTYTQTGNYEHHFSTTHGCDSSVTLQLTIDTLNKLVSIQDSILLAEESAATNYQWMNCDSGYLQITGATQRSFQPAFSGKYAVVLAKHSCYDTSECMDFMATGIRRAFAFRLLVHPNPTKGILYYEMPFDEGDVAISDVCGKIIIQLPIKEKKGSMNLSELPDGVYYLQVQARGEKAIAQVIKI